MNGRTATPAVAVPPLRHYAKVTAVVIGVALLAFLLYRVRSVALSVFLGFFVATGCEPFIRALERRGLKRGLAVLLFVVSAVLAFAAIVAALLAPAVRQMSELIASLPQLVDQLSAQLEKWGLHFDQSTVTSRLEGLLDNLPGLLATSAGTVYGILGGILGAVFGLFTVAALTVYFMLAMPRMQAFAARALADPERVEVMNLALGRVGAYVTGQFVVSLTAGVVAGTGLGLLGVPYAAVLGVAVALLSGIPQVGATLGAVLCTLVALTDSVGLAAITFVFLLAYQQFENYLLAPRVFSKAVDLSPVAVFIAVLVGAAGAGAIGALTALPVTAAMKVVFRYLFRTQPGRIAPYP